MGNFSCLSESDRAPTMRLAVRAYPWIQAGQSGFPVRIRWTFRTCLLELKMKKFVAKTIRYYKLSFVQLYQMNRLWGLATAHSVFYRSVSRRTHCLWTSILNCLCPPPPQWAFFCPDNKKPPLKAVFCSISCFYPSSGRCRPKCA